MPKKSGELLRGKKLYLGLFRFGSADSEWAPIFAGVDGSRFLKAYINPSKKHVEDVLREFNYPGLSCAVIELTVSGEPEEIRPEAKRPSLRFFPGGGGKRKAKQ